MRAFTRSDPPRGSGVILAAGFGHGGSVGALGAVVGLPAVSGGVPTGGGRGGVMQREMSAALLFRSASSDGCAGRVRIAA